MRLSKSQSLCPPERPTSSVAKDGHGLLPGTVCIQYVRCGKAACACREGKLHGPYHYRVWREGGTVQKAYVRPEDAPSVIAACAAYSQYSRALRGLRRERQEVTERLEKDLRRAKRAQERRALARPRSSGH